MKLQTSVFAAAAVALGIVACAAPAEEQERDEETGTTSQALCRFPPCTKLGGGTWGGLASSGTLDPGTGGSSSGGSGTGETFSCTPVGKRCTDPDYRRLACNPYDANDCVCMIGCGGGGWPYGTFNPCPSWSPRYTCNSLGSCRCY